MAGPDALDVVVVSYRCRELVLVCLAALRAHPPTRGLRIVVVDNDSRDGTVEAVRESYPEVELVPAHANLGFAAATNVGIRLSAGEYVLVLNPDTRVTPSALERLLELMDAHPEAAVCGCRLEREDGSFDHAAKRSFPTPLSALGHFTGLGRRRDTGRLAAYRAPSVERGPVDAVNGAFMLMRRRALDDVGLFDEGYWMYMEDLDLSYRLARAGWTTWYEPDVVVVHTKHGSAGERRSLRLNYAFHYGMFRFYRKHYAAERNPVANIAVYVGIATKFAASALRAVLVRSVSSAPPQPGSQGLPDRDRPRAFGKGR